MAKGEGRGWRKFIPSAPLIVRIAVALVIMRLITRHIVLPNVSKLPGPVIDYWPTPS